ncbi:hypothetical protein D8Y24_01690 [Agrococcus lahaulensis]|nr:hypothetical protein D8Y24_01690 [Agrococcus lahaulensis]
MFFIDRSCRLLLKSGQDDLRDEEARGSGLVAARKEQHALHGSRLHPSPSAGQDAAAARAQDGDYAASPASPCS